jgi:hypothetical protein
MENTFGNSKLFRVNGWYASYNGAESDNYEDWEEVYPVTVSKIEYKSVSTNA